MGLFSRLLGYRWSLYIVENGTLRYAMHEDSAMRMVGFVMLRYADGGHPRPPWSLHLHCNKARQSFELLPIHFTPDGENVTAILTQAIERIDPGWRVRGSTPILEEVPSRRRIKVAESLADYTDPDRAEARLRALFAAGPREETFYDIMDRVFGKRE